MAKYRVWLTPPDDAPHSVDVEATGPQGALVIAGHKLDLDPFGMQEVQVQRLPLAEKTIEHPVVDTEDRAHQHQHAWLAAHGPLIEDALHRLDPTLVCWWEGFQNNLVVQISRNEEAWFGIDSLEEPWYASILDHSQGGYTGSITTTTSAKSRVPWGIAQGIFATVKELQGRR